MSTLNTWVFGSALEQVCVFAHLHAPSLSIVTVHRFCLDGWPLLPFLVKLSIKLSTHLCLGWDIKTDWGQSAALSLQYKSWDGWHETSKGWQPDCILIASASWVPQAALIPVQCKSWFFSFLFVICYDECKSGMKMKNLMSQLDTFFSILASKSIFKWVLIKR